MLPRDWNSNNGTVYSLLYQDQNNVGFLLKAVSIDDVLAVSLLNFKTEKSADLSLTPAELIDLNKGDPVVKNVDETVKLVCDSLAGKLLKKKKCEEKDVGSKAKQSEKDQPRQDPLMIGGRNPRGINPGMPQPGGLYPSVGGADLDPLRSGVMGGGMLMDPRQGRDIEPRWDPVGPGVGGIPPRGRGGRGGQRGGFGGPGRNFGDEMRPPDFNDDNDDDYNNMFM